MHKLTIHITANNGNTIISVTDTLTPDNIMNTIIIVTANNSVVPFIIITEASKYPSDLFCISSIPESIAAGTINPKSMA